MAYLFFLLAFVSEILGTLAGFGSSVFFVPIASLIFDFKIVLVLTGLLHIFSTSAQLVLFRKDIDWKLMVKLGVPSVLFVILGALLHEKIELKYLKLLMGIFLSSFAIALIKEKSFKIRPTNLNVFLGGALAGFFAGLIGTGGAIRGATLTAFNLAKNVFIGTSAGIDLVADFGRTWVYLESGFLTADYYWYVPILLVTGVAGSYVGKYLLKFIPQQTFRKFVLFMILGSGLVMVYEFFFASVSA